MRSISLIALCLALFLTGCASTGSKDTSVLSEDAPVDKIVAKADEAAVGGDFLAASTLYRHALTIEPDDVDVWYRLGASLILLNEQQQAMWAFSNVLEQEPEHAGALQRVALYLTSKGDLKQAPGYLDRPLAVDPDTWRAYNALGVVADLKGEPVGAAAYYRSAIDLNPDSAMLWNNLGYSLYLAENLVGAEENMRKALSLDPDYRAAKRNLSLIFARQGLYAEALKIMLTAESKATAYTDIGLLAFKLGDYDQAELLLAEAVRMSPTYNAVASRNLAAVREKVRRIASNG